MFLVLSINVNTKTHFFCVRLESFSRRFFGIV